MRVILKALAKKRQGDLGQTGLSYLELSPYKANVKFDRLQLDEEARFREPNKFTVKVGLGKEGISRNRYRGVVPWDYNRVKLPVTEGHNDYVNASWVKLSTVDPNISKSYIVTQGPTKKTVDHFWQMLFHYCEGPIVIVMLTGLKEPSAHGYMEKCAKYWPSRTSDVLPISKTGGFKHDLQVRMLSDQVHDFYELRELEIVDLETSISKKVHHFYYNTWQDFGNPEEGADMIKFVEIVNSYNTSNDPLIVHCSAGIGRSGTYVAIDAGITLGLWDDVDATADPIFSMVTSMREQRPGMVQRPEQYQYIHEELKRFHKTLAKN